MDGQFSPTQTLSSPWSSTQSLMQSPSLLWNFIGHSLPWPCTNPCPSPVNIGDQVLFSPLDRCSSFLFPKWQSPFKVFIVTPTPAKLEGLLHWIHLSHIKSFTPHLKTIFLCTHQNQQDPASLSFRGHQDQSLFSQFQKNEASPQQSCSIPLDWETNMEMDLSPSHSPVSTNPTLCYQFLLLQRHIQKISNQTINQLLL